MKRFNSFTRAAEVALGQRFEIAEIAIFCNSLSGLLQTSDGKVFRFLANEDAFKLGATWWSVGQDESVVRVRHDDLYMPSTTLPAVRVGTCHSDVRLRPHRAA
jgi:hypothetical protein